MFVPRSGCLPSCRRRVAFRVEMALSLPNEMGLNGVASLLRAPEREQQQQPRR